MKVLVPPGLGSERSHFTAHPDPNDVGDAGSNFIRVAAVIAACAVAALTLAAGYSCLHPPIISSLFQ